MQKDRCTLINTLCVEYCIDTSCLHILINKNENNGSMSKEIIIAQLWTNSLYYNSFTNWAQ